MCSLVRSMCFNVNWNRSLSTKTVSLKPRDIELFVELTMKALCHLHTMNIISFKFDRLD